MIGRAEARYNPVPYFPTAWITFGFAIAISGAMFLAFPDSLGVKILAMTLFVLISAASVRFDLTHPFVWLGPPFLLYSISAPLLFYVGIHPLTIRSVYRIEELDFSGAVEIHYLGLVACLLIIGTRRMSFDAVLNDDRREAFFTGVMPVLLLAGALAAIAVSAIIAGGFASKNQVILEGSWVTRLSFGFNIAATCVVVYVVREFSAERKMHAYIFIAAIAAVGVLVVLYTGQRGFLFRFLVVVVFAVHIAHRKLTVTTILPLGIAGAVLISVMAVLKSSLLTGSSEILTNLDMQTLLALPQEYEYLTGGGESPIVVNGKWLLLMMLGSEFMTSGNNLALLLLRVPHEIPYQYGVTLVNDIVRALSPGFLFNPLEIQSTVSVFNRLFFPGGYFLGKGQGFSFVGTGYFNFGIAGAVMIMLIFGAAIRLFYRCAAKSPMGLFFYIGYIPIAMFTARSDLATPVSQGLKHVLVPLLLMLFISVLSTRRTPGLDRRDAVDRRATETGPSRIVTRERRAPTQERRSRADRRIYPRTSRKYRGRFPDPPGSEPENT